MKVTINIFWILTMYKAHWQSALYTLGHSIVPTIIIIVPLIILSCQEENSGFHLQKSVLPQDFLLSVNLPATELLWSQSWKWVISFSLPLICNLTTHSAKYDSKSPNLLSLIRFLLTSHTSSSQHSCSCSVPSDTSLSIH